MRRTDACRRGPRTSRPSRLRRSSDVTDCGPLVRRQLVDIRQIVGVVGKSSRRTLTMNSQARRQQSVQIAPSSAPATKAEKRPMRAFRVSWRGPARIVYRLGDSGHTPISRVSLSNIRINLAGLAPVGYPMSDRNRRSLLSLTLRRARGRYPLIPADIARQARVASRCVSVTLIGFVGVDTPTELGAAQPTLDNPGRLNPAPTAVSHSPAERPMTLGSARATGSGPLCSVRCRMRARLVDDDQRRFGLPVSVPLMHPTFGAVLPIPDSFASSGTLPTISTGMKRANRFSTHFMGKRNARSGAHINLVRAE